MGCTSSAPNMTPSLSHSEKDLKFLDEADEKQMKEGEEKEVNHEKGKESNGIQVLPTCDTLGDSTQLDRHIKSLVNTTSTADLQQDSHMNRHVVEHDNENARKDTGNSNADTIVDLQTEEKLSKLEEVVEKVVELYVENGYETKLTISEPATTEDILVKTDESKQEAASEKREHADENKEAEEETEEVASPSQSESSRATRWEALADIAAELPPSLAVDPVTGQIYALSK
ncbi:uncharacterized protein LOC126372397 [Pectinophora gossypiella]|uniref:uncharacterized protein LOC126372397 n=1 Tax=Pectinophora gossypiella TaxID=13191 RepID=UPI00214E2FBD|nr:uncharacterized protein LOC126372397 [Pectinophora gossypiella]